ncbi:MAG: PHP domain-containing protein [Thermomicrobiales bacterium]|nr:PHP domain-containing protein [Thermomicrobiales bacterium]
MSDASPSIHLTPGAVDLHCHTNASDGFLSPAELIALAAAQQMRTLAITDHDTIDGLAEATAAALEHGIEVVPGVEISSNTGGSEIHMLGYFVDPASPILSDHLRWCIESRIARVEQICRRLTAAGLPLTVDEVLAVAGSGSVGRPHVAQVMIARGYVDSIGDAFARYLGRGKPGFVQRENVAPAKAVGVIIESGGAAVLAHPYATGAALEVLPDLIDAGLAGLEAWYGEYDQRTRERLAAMAEKLGLIATGGSDFHGTGFKEGRNLGSVAIDHDVVDQLRQAAGSGPRA